jgi:hypothetical protein
MNLSEAQSDRRARGQAVVEAQIEDILNAIGLSEDQCLQLTAENVGVHARAKLKGILGKYRKSAHPFAECKRDQMSNGLAEEMANKRCAVLKDIITGTKNWRKGRHKTNMSQSSQHESVSCSIIDNDIAILLDNVDTKTLADILKEES